MMVRPGQASLLPINAGTVFRVVALAAAVLLLVMAPYETTWTANQPYHKQPGFWSVVAICGMVLLGLVDLLSWRRAAQSTDAASVSDEAIRFLKALEFAVWFAIYFYLVPVTGYLPTTLVFCVALTYRLGYRSTRFVIAALLTGLATVVVFKSLLSAKIPGGAVYELLPAGLRNFMILYL